MPPVVIDVGEHAFYIDHQNRPAECVEPLISHLLGRGTDLPGVGRRRRLLTSGFNKPRSKVQPAAWSQPSGVRMVKHVVLLRIRRDVPPSTIEGLFAEIAGLRSKIVGIHDFSWGPYSSPEGLNRGFTHGFVMTFADEASRDAYLPHPEHERVKAQILDVLDYAQGA